MAQPMLLEIDPPISICSDTQGQLSDVIHLFNQNGWPPKMRYLFLGDYVDRRPKNVETVCLMFAIFYLLEVFDWMPISALVAGRILCIYGGISPDLTDLDQIRKIAEVGGSSVMICLK